MARSLLRQIYCNFEGQSFAMNILQILSESVRFAMQSLKANRMRSFLSLLGMTLGIFSIIVVFSIVDTFTKSIKASIESVGSDVVYVQKWPWSGGPGVAWWKIFQWPEPTTEEFEKLESRLNTAEFTAIVLGIRGNLNFRNNVTENVRMNGVSADYNQIWQIEIAEGRYFSEIESSHGKPVVVLGYEVAQGLFGGLDPVGRQIRVLGEKVTVIGVVTKEGSKMIGESHDELILMPVNFMRRKINERSVGGGAIMVKAKPGISLEQLKSEIEGIMRGVRRLRPKADDNFSLNEISIIQQSISGLFTVLWWAGLIIGGFALLAGGFGVANIMFVSVAERTSQIGVQKALGARSKFILAQFMGEAIILSVIGGILGLTLTYLVITIVNARFDIELILSFKNILIGVFTSALIGLLFGLFPALNASRKDPVEAMRAN